MRSSGVNTLATADRVMVSAAQALDVSCEAFC
jgi:hypothetical protein